MSEPVESLSSIISESPYFCNNIESLLKMSMFDPSKQLWQGFFFKFWEGALGPFRLGKEVWLTPKFGKIVKVHNYVIFGQ